MNRQSSHLHEIAHRGFRYIGLPIRIGDETDRSIEGEIRGDRVEFLRIERKQSLESLHRVKYEKANQAEDQHGQTIGDPMLLIPLVNTASPIEAALDWHQ
jgi:hypothetical protein